MARIKWVALLVVLIAALIGGSYLAVLLGTRPALEGVLALLGMKAGTVLPRPFIVSLARGAAVLATLGALVLILEDAPGRRRGSRPQAR